MIDKDEDALVQSVIILGEVYKVKEMLPPKERRVQQEKLEVIRTVLESPNVLLFDVTSPVIRRAPKYRFQHDLKLPDAIHQATAVLNDCDWFIFLGRDFKDTPDISMFSLHNIQDKGTKLAWKTRHKKAFSR